MRTCRLRGIGSALGIALALLMISDCAAQSKKPAATETKAKSGLEAVAENEKEKSAMNDPHWQNFLECVRTRQRPIAEIETTVRTSQACILSNIALRSGMTLDWDDQAKTVKQEAARKYLKAQYRSPWKLVV